MHWHYTPYSLPLLLAGAGTILLALYVSRRRETPGASALAVLLVALAWWSLMYAMELSGADLQTKVFWAQVKYVGIVAVPIAWLAFALQYTGSEEWLTGRNLALLSVEPLATMVLVATNDAHNLIWKTRLDTSGVVSVLDLGFGAWFWVNLAYSYSLLLLGTVLLLRQLVPSLRLYRGQSAVLLLAVVVPWASHVLYISGKSPVPHLDLTPFAFAVSAVMLVWGLLRFRLLDLVPVARNVLIEEMGDGVLVVDAHNRIVDLNPAAQGILGCLTSKAVGCSVAELIPGQAPLLESNRNTKEARGEAKLEDNGGVERYYELVFSLLKDPGGLPAGRLILLRDITERKALEKELAHRAAHDPLTDLPNRALFMDRLEHALARTRRHGGKVAVLFVDLDGFKRVNDSLGHEAGDRLLVAVAARLRSCLRPEDTAARLGGDEFVVLLEDIEEPKEAILVAERIIRELKDSFALSGREVYISTSIGIALGDKDPSSQAKDLLREADGAMYRAKERGEACYELVRPEDE